MKVLNMAERDWYGNSTQESMADRQAREWGEAYARNSQARDDQHNEQEAEISAMNKRHNDEIVGEPPYRYLEHDKSLDKGILQEPPAAPDLSVSDPGRPYRTQRSKDTGATDRT
jgi:hypothetical protein